MFTQSKVPGSVIGGSDSSLPFSLIYWGGLFLNLDVLMCMAKQQNVIYRTVMNSIEIDYGQNCTARPFDSQSLAKLSLNT